MGQVLHGCAPLRIRSVADNFSSQRSTKKDGIQISDNFGCLAVIEHSTRGARVATRFSKRRRERRTIDLSRSNPMPGASNSKFFNNMSSLSHKFCTAPMMDWNEFSLFSITC